jgi:hypothetical protein
VIGFFLIPVGSFVLFRQGSISTFTYLMSPDLFDWLFCTVVGILSAVFGPYIFQKATDSGRGDLEEIRKHSRGSQSSKR